MGRGPATIAYNMDGLPASRGNERGESRGLGYQIGRGKDGLVVRRLNGKEDLKQGITHSS